jgi:hypothetical protein
MMAPTRNITMRNLRIVSRNWCIGSATFGGVYDILFEDSTIGDLDTVRTVPLIQVRYHDMQFCLDSYFMLDNFCRGFVSLVRARCLQQQ